MISFYQKNCINKEKPCLLHSKVLVVDEALCPMEKETEIFNRTKCNMEKSIVWQIFQNDVTGCTTMINSSMRDIINKIDFSNEQVIQHDWLIAQVAYIYHSKYFYPEQTIKYRQHSNNVISAKKITLFERIRRKTKTGLVYPYYDQVKTLLFCIDNTIDEKTVKLLTDFSNLKYKKKITRILWHIKNQFYREGNIVYKMYQLISC